MKKRIFILLLIVMMTISVCGCAEDDKKELTKKADKIASAMISDYGVISVQYALIDNGEITLSGNKGVFAKDGRRTV